MSEHLAAALACVLIGAIAFVCAGEISAPPELRPVAGMVLAAMAVIAMAVTTHTRRMP